MTCAICLAGQLALVAIQSRTAAAVPEMQPRDVVVHLVAAGGNST